jgi:hypothetical protein
VNKRVYSIIENLVFSPKSNHNGFAGKDSKLVWSTGVLECWSVGRSQNPNFNLNKSLALLHHSSMLPHEGKAIETYSGGGSEPDTQGPDCLLIFLAGSAQFQIVWARVFQLRKADHSSGRRQFR